MRQKMLEGDDSPRFWPNRAAGTSPRTRARHSCRVVRLEPTPRIRVVPLSIAPTLHLLRRLCWAGSGMLPAPVATSHEGQANHCDEEDQADQPTHETKRPESVSPHHPVSRAKAVGIWPDTSFRRLDTSPGLPMAQLRRPPLPVNPIPQDHKARDGQGNRSHDRQYRDYADYDLPVSRHFTLQFR